MPIIAREYYLDGKISTGAFKLQEGFYRLDCSTGEVALTVQGDTGYIHHWYGGGRVFL